MKLAPLDPEQFLRWAWANGPKERLSKAFTLADLQFEYAEDADPETVRRWVVAAAARTRRNQRLGRKW